MASCTPSRSRSAQQLLSINLCQACSMCVRKLFAMCSTCPHTLLTLVADVHPSS